MKNILFLLSPYILLYFFILGCAEKNVVQAPKYEIPSMGHDLSYHPYDAKLHDPNYIVCDSTNINSGRNRLKYTGGKNKLREDITSNYLYKQEYETFSGYIVIRFIVNCEGQSGRYRVQSLHLDFSPSNAPPNLLNYSVELIKSLNNWTKSSSGDPKQEYSKYINLKIKNGKIQHVLL